MSSETQGNASAATDVSGSPTDDVAGDGSAAAEGDGRTDTETSADAGMGWRGWVLVGVVVTCFLVIPGAIYLRPAAPADAGLSFIVAMLVLPMLPALLLGVAAVWSMSAGRGGSRR